MIDIVFNNRFASTLSEYDKSRQVNRQVLALPMYLGLGILARELLSKTDKRFIKFSTPTKKIRSTIRLKRFKISVTR